MVLPVALQTGGPGLGVSIAFVLVGVGLLAVFSRRSVGRLLTMLGTEPVAAGEVSPGMVELEGTVTPAGETFDASAGMQRAEAVVIQTRQSGGQADEGGLSEFVLPVPQQLAPGLLNDTSVRPFYLEDDTGRVLVDAAHADISLDSDYSRSDDLSDHRRVEAWLEPGDEVYVLGEAVPAEVYPERATPPDGLLRGLARFLQGDIRHTAEETADGEDVVVTRTPRASEFVVSDTSGGRSLLRQGLMAAFWTLSGLLAVGTGLYFFVGALGL